MASLASSTPFESILSIPGPVPLIIDNKPVTTSNTYTVLSPNDPENPPLHDVYAANLTQVNLAIESAQKAFGTWRKTTFLQRRELLIKAADILKRRSEEFTALTMSETTNSFGLAAFETWSAVTQLDEVAANIATAMTTVQPPALDNPFQQAYVSRHPFGVVLSVVPWNGPIALSVRAVINPIAAGNTVILKTSEYSPKSNMIIVDCLREAGIPDGVVNVVHVNREDGWGILESMIKHPAIRKVNFTGSDATATHIAQICGKWLKPVMLELGGNATQIVLEDADVEHAAKCAAFGKFLHSGQVCMSTNNVLVHESIADVFSDAVKRELVNVVAGHAVGPNQLRGLFNPASVRRVQQLVEQARNAGAKVIISEVTNVMQPVVLDHVTPNMDIFRTEIFGPALGISRFKTVEEAITVANESEYGLAAAVHGKDVARAMQVASQIDCGNVSVNSHTLDGSPRLPYGGWKKSGFGVFNGLQGIQEFTQIKVTVVSPIGYAQSLSG
ncbi:aldehyde dehydrogenase [Cantharellus anzutake]|uniref:aldehyde dehydrogenase n=1 Tax=Cantharellus anzutake TaxID=1750568 RepID=UPI001903C82F|nr:aldehyde dehydrogenase [Cantharellus anzutake]KAF8342984.1 aldehyde dehydrogenase [Cantharellus anzutake]